MVKAKKLVCALTVSLFWVLAFSFADAATTKDLKTVTMGFFGWSANSWPMLVADKKGFFEAEGIKLDAVAIPSGPGLVQALVGGSLQVVMMSPESAVNAVERGGADLITVMGAQQMPLMALYSSSDIKKLADLKGKKIGVSNIKSQDALFARMILRPAGVQDNEYDILTVGGTGQRLSGIIAGVIQAAMLLPPITYAAKRQGLVKLGQITDVLKNYQFQGYQVRRDWAQKNRPTVIRWIRAVEKGRLWLMQPANKEEAANFLTGVAKVSKSDGLLSHDEMLEHARFFTSKIDIEGYRNLIEQLRERGDIDKVQDPMRYIDLSFMKEALGK